MSDKYKTGIGFDGERVVRDWLIKSGYMILPASQIEGMGAPMLLSKDIKTILPDNLTWKDCKAGWIEVKTKSYSTKHLTTPVRFEHGMPLRHWVAYEIIQQRTYITVSLAILELDSHLLLLSEINKLKASGRIFPMENEMHIFFGRDDFPERYDIASPLPNPIKPQAVRTLLQDKAPIGKTLRLFEEKSVYTINSKGESSGKSA